MKRLPPHQIDAASLADGTYSLQVVGGRVTGLVSSSGGGGSSLAVEDEGVEILAAATRLNFAGSGVTVTDAGSGEATVTIPGGGGGGGDANWIAPTLSSGWVNYGTDAENTYAPAGYRKDGNGFVHLRGLLKSGSVGSAHTMFTLPVGYRPSARLIFPGSSNSAPRLDVTSAGRVVPNNGGNIFFSISGVVFYADQ